MVGQSGPISKKNQKIQRNEERKMVKQLDFRSKRRQMYLDEESYRNAIAKIEAANAVESSPEMAPVDACRDLKLTA